MSVPFSVSDSDSKRATTDVVVELSHSRFPPTLPFELKDHVSPNTWAIRMSALIRLASQYYRPTFERTYLVIILVLTFLVPITTYYIILQALESTKTKTKDVDLDKQVWLARFSSFAVTIATWIVLSMPVVVWKYLGKVRVTRLAEEWTRSDALAAPSYGAAPVWKASTPGMLREAIVLMVTVPLIKKSHFDRDSYLPPYIAAGDDTLPPYRDSNMVSWSRDLKGGIRYGELPIYSDGKSTVVQV